MNNDLKMNMLVSDGVRFMQSITDYYGAEDGIKVWNSICEAIDPEVKGQIFVSMLMRNAVNGVTFRMDVSTSHSKVGAIKCIREYTGMGLKEAKDLMDQSFSDYVTIECDRSDEHRFARDLRNQGCFTK
jgi:hypothetical protein